MFNDLYGNLPAPKASGIAPKDPTSSDPNRKVETDPLASANQSKHKKPDPHTVQDSENQKGWSSKSNRLLAPPSSLLRKSRQPNKSTIPPPRTQYQSHAKPTPSSEKSNPSLHGQQLVRIPQSSKSKENGSDPTNREYDPFQPNEYDIVAARKAQEEDLSLKSNKRTMSDLKYNSRQCKSQKHDRDDSGSGSGCGSYSGSRSPHRSSSPLHSRSRSSSSLSRRNGSYSSSHSRSQFRCRSSYSFASRERSYSRSRSRSHSRTPLPSYTRSPARSHSRSPSSSYVPLSSSRSWSKSPSDKSRANASTSERRIDAVALCTDTVDTRAALAISGEEVFRRRANLRHVSNTTSSDPQSLLDLKAAKAKAQAFAASLSASFQHNSPQDIADKQTNSTHLHISGEEAWKRRGLLKKQDLPSGNDILKSENLFRRGGASKDKKSDTHNVASKLMQKMGWKEGDGLGRRRQGMVDPLSASRRDRKKGLGVVDKHNSKVDDYEHDGKRQIQFSTHVAKHGKANSRIILLANMVTHEEIDDELEQETAEECKKFGKVISCVVHENKSPGIRPEHAVRIFVEFAAAQSAANALMGMDGRFFGGRIIRASYFSEERFYAKKFEADEDATEKDELGFDE